MTLAVISITGWPFASQADATFKEIMTINIANFIKMNGTTVEAVTADKRRTDTESHCEGLMAMICGKNATSDIVRLDTDREWRLDQKKKSYTEALFPTPEERAQAKEKMHQRLEQAQACMAKQSATPAPDKSKCGASPPRSDVQQTDETATIAGHLTRRTTFTITKSCTDESTGDVCDIVSSLDTWLTSDEVPGFDQKVAFDRAHMKKLGLDPEDAELQGFASKFLAQYAGELKELGQKAQGVKGTPLRTVFRVSYGGAHCGKAKSAGGTGQSPSTSDAVASAASTAAANAAVGAAGAKGSLFGSTAASIGSKLFGDLGRKKASSASSSGAAPADATPRVTLFDMTVETTAADSSAVPPERFELPAGYKLEVPKPSPAKDDAAKSCMAESN